jgi:hypothetical protein
MTHIPRLLRFALPLALLTAACADDPVPQGDDIGVSEQGVSTTSFTATYTGQGSNATTCNSSFAITGQEPSTTGTFPVFLYMVGTTESATNASATAAVAGMASRGFVAATIAYNSGSFGNCSAIDGKTKCIFDSTTSTSAVSVLCARAKADCSKGILAGGFSQGAVIATQSKNFNSGVRAAWGMGDGVKYSSFDLTSCQANGNRALPSDHLRSIAGQKDQFLGASGSFSFGAGSITNVRSQLQTLTGFNCGSTATNCLQSNGSGWYIVQNNQVQDGSADHCFMRASGDCSGSQNSLDSGWQNGTDVWELSASLSWLASFASP